MVKVLISVWDSNPFLRRPGPVPQVGLNDEGFTPVLLQLILEKRGYIYGRNKKSTLSMKKKGGGIKRIKVQKF